MAQNTNISFDDFIQKFSQTISKVDKVNDQKIIPQDTQELNSFLATTFSGACVNYTNEQMLNPSINYHFANTAGVNHCSHPSVVNPINMAPSCVFVDRQSRCPFYVPDLLTLKKSTSTTLNLSLTKIRTYDGSYVYLIHNDTGSVYQKFDFKKLSITDNDLDAEALRLFDIYLHEIQLTDLSYSDEDQFNNNNSNTIAKSSYLLSLIS